MSLFDRFFNKEVKEQKKTSSYFFGSSRQKSSSKVNTDNAVKVTAVFACVRLIAEQMASLSFPVYSINNNSIEKNREHLNWNILNVSPNPYTTSFEFWKMYYSNLLIYGKAYAEIERDKRTKEPKALWIIPADKVTKIIDDKTHKPFYEVDYLDKKYIVQFENMLAIKWQAIDELSSFEPIELARETIGLSMAAESFAEEYFANGTHPSGIIEYPGQLTEDGLTNYKNSVREAYSGLGNQHRVMLLEEGMKFTKLISQPNEGQMIESRKFQVEEIARFYNVPPNKIMHLEKTSYNAIEEMNIAFVQDCLVPYAINVQQKVNQLMFFDNSYAEYNFGSLLRGKLADRYNAYATARQWGWLSVNEIREKENLSNIGPEGDIYLTPLNMVDTNEDISKGDDNNG